MDKWENRHRLNVSSYQRRIDEIYAAAAKEAAAIGMSINDFNPNKPFTFADYPATKARIEKLLKELNENINVLIANGINIEWMLANSKNDALCNYIFGDNVQKFSKEILTRYYSTNSKALEAFAKRKTAGLSLSEKVWNYAAQFKEELELALDLGIRDGIGAQKMSQNIRSYLKQPNKLFRRVKDQHGMLRLSQAAKAYHPGQGVYRSSYKNARRLAATETNTAYRTSDYLRYQQLDFVVGIEIHLSNNHTLNGQPFTDICDDLKGKYPKEFKFVGWHPLCRCYVTSILKTEQELKADNKRILDGEEPNSDSANKVADTPPQFKKWIKENKDRLEASKSHPYFIKDNKKYIDEVLNPKPQPKQVIEAVRKETSKMMPDEFKAKSEYLHGEDYTFDKDFFDLVDPKRSIKLELIESKGQCYSSWLGNMVHLEKSARMNYSEWYRKSIVYHEYGHCIEAQRGLGRDPKLIAMREAQIKNIKKKSAYNTWKSEYSIFGGMQYKKVNEVMSRVAYIDGKLAALTAKVINMQAETFIKKGITKNDVLEQIGGTRDTIKSLVTKYGSGHTTAYFKSGRMKETEYLAHAFENTFLGNVVFKKYLPDIYDEMRAYIKALKPL